MNKEQQKELAGIISRHAPTEGENTTAIPGVIAFKASTTHTAFPTVYNPSLCVIAQGKKQVLLEKEIYRYGPSEYFLVSVDMPVIGQITLASQESPYLLLKMDIDLKQVSELVMHSSHARHTDFNTTRGVFVARVDEILADGILRLARLLDTPHDIPVLASQTMREVLYRILCSDYGNIVAQRTLKGSHMQRIANAIHQIQSHIDEALSVDELAELVGMSVSSFYAHFKSVTAMSPLQYQKTLRLIEARTLMLSNSMDAASAAYQVGYESPSQFNREYARMFGNPPGRDIHRLKEHGHLDGRKRTLRP
ncbi:AraC family transcriptional regulator [Desulfovibrio inopinatus]|uniref:AraC family transcriptional regulator n=1 Tax=Desulfovibrio inopinatus TaxID=102109 RepID=UPI00041E4342|nr:AraC family transcriptional regulator [Desulfovibrio inopinatus]